ncbi:hypothetical protein GCM10027431_19970 [Lysobacter rhizosphaerae]
MARLSFEERGLLRILDKIRDQAGSIGPSVRFALVERGLIEAGDPVRLTPMGEQLLEELRLRPGRATEEFPALGANASVSAR